MFKKLDFKYINECFTADFENGVLYWGERPRHHFHSNAAFLRWNGMFPGKEVGCLFPCRGGKRFYKNVKLKPYGTLYIHRIMYLLYHEVDAGDILDHFDGDGLNNSISNIRPANHTLNARNRLMKFSNKSGISGVWWREDKQVWVVTVGNKPKQKTKTTSDFFEACCIRKSWELDLSYTERHGS